MDPRRSARAHEAITPSGSAWRSRLRLFRDHHARAPHASTARQGPAGGRVAETATVMEHLEKRIDDGYHTGLPVRDRFEPRSFLRRGVFSCTSRCPTARRSLSTRPGSTRKTGPAHFLFHRYKRRAFEVYSSRYLKTQGRSTGRLAAVCRVRR